MLFISCHGNSITADLPVFTLYLCHNKRQETYTLRYTVRLKLPGNRKVTKNSLSH